MLLGALGGAFSGLSAGESPTSLSMVENGGEEPRTFPNLYDDPEWLARELADAEAAGVAPIEVGTQAFDDAVSNGGNYLWAVGPDGKLRILFEASDKVKHSVRSVVSRTRVVATIRWLNSTPLTHTSNRASVLSGTRA
ncbi:hypothetical protein AB0L75_11525 [Streptomyces sp. NPDC052101]|uniref:hypothetical protein n=1 Tax=Streptomyces sp. NPDC052101 TaxID=3155763 RepID=UPI003416E87E